MIEKLVPCSLKGPHLLLVFHPLFLARPSTEEFTNKL